MSQKESFSSVSLADVKDVTKEAAVGLPAKKKRRMGMCGLTEKERSHFLQMQKRENGQSGQETVEKYICNYTADPVAPEEIISSPPSLPIPVGSVTDEAEIKLQSSPCGGDDRTETEAHIAVTTSDGTMCDPGCLKGNSGEAEGGIVSAPEQTDHTKSDPPAEEDEEELVGNQEQQELEGQTAETMTENPQEQRKDEEDESAVVGQSPDITSVCSNPTGKGETENQVTSEAAVQQVNSVTRTRDERRVELTGDAGHGDGAEAGASSTDTRSGGFNSGCVELCGAAVTPSGSQRKDSFDRDDEPADGRPAVNAELHQNGDTSDPFESGYSDSQLNTILLTEEEVMEREEYLGSADTHEDATDLICGLIRELSSLNRMVMATHRDLENLRRSSKSSRSSIR
ncbi:FK506-binding protein 5-like [Pempheris klunzingeri]|uniref:FK506-binding protein 5-like n=1 Tax=Pempheris klunzingeri TaxID=3127111 RepID=UPI00397FBDC0